MPTSKKHFTDTVSVERIESEFPLLIEAHALMPNTGGAGKYRGSMSVYRTYRFLKEGRILLRTCRSTTVPYGLAGGCDGTAFRAVLYSGGDETELPHQMFIDTDLRETVKFQPDLVSEYP